MSYTQTQLIQAALEELSAVQIGQTAATDDSTLVGLRVTGILADLSARRITSALLTSPFADAVFPDLLRIVVERVAPEYGRPTNELTLTAAEGRLGEAQRLSRTQTGATLAILEQL